MKVQKKISIKKSDSDKTLYCYLRVSTQEQAKKNLSLETQASIGKRVAKTLGLKYYECNEGGTSSVARSEDSWFIKLKDLVEQGKVKNIWYLDRSRWSRTTVEDLNLREWFRDYEVSIYEGEHGKLRRFDDEDDEMLDTIETAMNQRQRQKTKKRSRLGKIFVSEKYGKHKSINLGGVLFGWRNQIDDDNTKILVKHKEEQAHLNNMFKMYANGKSLKDIKTYLQSKGVKTRLGNVNWSLGSIHKILMNEKYIGHAKWTDKKTGKQYAINMERSISQTLFNKVQKMLQKNQKNKGSNKIQHDSLFGRFLVCNCGEGVTSYYQKRTSVLKGEYFTKTYYCMSKHNQWKGKLVKVCNNRRSMDMDRTDEFLLSQIQDVLSKSHKFKDLFKQKALGRKAQKKSEVKSQVKFIEKKIDNIGEKIANLQDSIAEAYIDKALAKDKSLVKKIVDRLLEEIADYEQERNILQQEIKNLDEMQEWVDWVTGYGEDIKKKFADINKRKLVLEDVIDKIVVTEVMGESRGKKIQVGHKFDIKFKVAIVNDKLKYADENDKSKGYDVDSGRKTLKTGVQKNLTTSNIRKDNLVQNEVKKSVGKG